LSCGVTGLAQPDDIRRTGTASARHSVSVTGVITDDGGRALLIQRRDNQHWEPPGGVLELGESIHDGLRREVREENGLQVEPVALTGVYKNMPRGIIALVFRCKTTGGELTPSDETQAFKWATEEQVRELATEAYATRVTDAMHDAPAVIRQHDGTRIIQ
jgi:8-oxo-dGTP diphosphatase